MHRMASLVGDDATNQRFSDQGQVANVVQNLVSHKLVFKPQDIVQDAVVGEYDGILERSSSNQTILLEFLHFAIEAKGSCRRYLSRKSVSRSSEFKGLGLNQRMIEVDGIADLETFG